MLTFIDDFLSSTINLENNWGILVLSALLLSYVFLLNALFSSTNNWKFTHIVILGVLSGLICFTYLLPAYPGCCIRFSININGSSYYYGPFFLYLILFYLFSDGLTKIFLEYLCKKIRKDI